MSPKSTRFIRFPAVMTVIMLPCCLATRCGGNQPIPPPTTPHRTYTTDFPLTEDPISEGGNWTNAFPAVNNQIETTPGFAFGQGPIPEDPIAILTGSWSPDQTAQAAVKINSTPTGCCHELELHLRMSPGTANYTGYEIICSTVSSPAYVQIVRWDDNGKWAYINNSDSTDYCVSGDVLKATISGSTISVYKNSTLLITGTDATYSNGNPGIGFYAANTADWSDYGFSTFSATDSLPTSISHAPATWLFSSDISPTHPFQAWLQIGELFESSRAWRD